MLKTLATIIICIGVGYGIYTTNPFGIQEHINPIAQAITNQVTQNPVAVIMGALPAITAVGGLAWKAISSIKAKAKTEVNEIAVNANQQIQSANAQVTTLTQQNETLQNRIAELESLPNDTSALQQTILQKEQDYRSKIQALQDMHTSFVQQITSGAKEVIDPATNQVYKLITIEKPIVK